MKLSKAVKISSPLENNQNKLDVMRGTFSTQRTLVTSGGRKLELQILISCGFRGLLVPQLTHIYITYSLEALTDWTGPESRVMVYVFCFKLRSQTIIWSRTETKLRPSSVTCLQQTQSNSDISDDVTALFLTCSRVGAVLSMGRLQK